MHSAQYMSKVLESITFSFKDKLHEAFKFMPRITNTTSTRYVY